MTDILLFILVIIRPTDPMIETVKARRAYYEDRMNQPASPVIEVPEDHVPWEDYKQKPEGVYDGSKPNQIVTKR